MRPESPSEYTSLPWPHELPLVLRAPGHQEERRNGLRPPHPEVGAATKVPRARVLEAVVGPREDRDAHLARRDPVVRNDLVRNDLVPEALAGQAAAVDPIRIRGRGLRGESRPVIRENDLMQGRDRAPGRARPLRVPATPAVAAAVPAPAVRPASRVPGRNAMIVPRPAAQGPVVIRGRGVQPAGRVVLRLSGILALSGTRLFERGGGVWLAGVRAR